MTLKEFRQATSHLPDDMEIFIGERLTEETYGLVNSTYVINVATSFDGIHKVRKSLILTED